MLPITLSAYHPHMLQLFEYYSRYQGFRGTFSRLPAWGRLVIGILALPGLLLAALSILALGVSILALLLLTVPAYRLLARMSGGEQVPEPGPTVSADMAKDMASETGRRHVDVRIIEEQPPA